MHWSVGLVLVLATTIFYCEFAADYVELAKCQKPELVSRNPKESVLSGLLLADTHLLGPVRGHWLDKLYREWHMRRAFQAAMHLFQPESVFVLGDLFDEGEFVNNEEFDKYVDRFHRHFRTPPNVPVISAVGNHDIGFHYKLTPYYVSRFENRFNTTAVKMYTLKDIHFVLINSMALQMDGCEFCEQALSELKEVSESLKCLKNAATCDQKEVLRQHKSYSRPILMQHIPTYRSSDKVCLEADGPLVEFRQDWEVLSKSSTRLLDEYLKPRLAFAGHSHHYCRSKNMLNIEEYTVASFSWRNKVNPSFLLASFSRTNYTVVKCEMVHQQTIYNIYVATICLCFGILLLKLFEWCNRRTKKIKAA